MLPWASMLRCSIVCVIVLLFGYAYLQMSAQERRAVVTHAACTHWVVLTSIQYPTDAVKRLVSFRDWCVVVVGDTKTPVDWQYPPAVYLDVDAQLSLGFSVAELLPFKHYGRKNIGYLFAIKHGAKYIYETDDDNFPRSAATLIPKANISDMMHYYGSADSGGFVVNPYGSFGQPTVWPRGYPLEEISKAPTATVTLASIPQSHAMIWQGLADGDPDVDALFRLTRKNAHRPLEIYFSPLASAISLPAGWMAPFNSQNTGFAYEALWAMLIPISTTFRVCDIWRGYWAQRLLWEIGGELSFTSPSVTQLRNAHDFHKDYMDERLMYERAGELVKDLISWRPQGSNFEQRIEELSRYMYRRGYWGYDDVKLTRAWIRDLKRIGYVFPSLRQPRTASIANSAQSAALPQQTSVLGSHEMYCRSCLPTPEPHEMAKETCSLHNQLFDCGSIFDWRYYTQRYSDVTNLSASEAESHWRVHGFSASRSSHPPPRRLKIVLMTKDDWPLLRSNVLYHAHLFGGHNIYVLDSSTSAEAIDFLRAVRHYLGVNVIFTPANLNEIEAELNFVMGALSNSADFLIKLDTDEFLALEGEKDQTPRIRTNPDEINAYLSDMPVDGSRYIVASAYHAIPNANCSVEEDPVMAQTHFRADGAPFPKVFFAAPAFEHIDLGAHGGRVRTPFNQTHLIRSRIALLHYHFQCYEKVSLNDRRAVLSHKYFSENDTLEQTLARCKELSTFNGASVHKVQSYCAHHRDPAAARATYYAGQFSMPWVDFQDVRRVIFAARERFYNISAIH